MPTLFTNQQILTRCHFLIEKPGAAVYMTQWLCKQNGGGVKPGFEAYVQSENELGHKGRSGEVDMSGTSYDGVP